MCVTRAFIDIFDAFAIDEEKNQKKYENSANDLIKLQVATKKIVK